METTCKPLFQASQVRNQGGVTKGAGWQGEVWSLLLLVHCCLPPLNAPLPQPRPTGPPPQHPTPLLCTQVKQREGPPARCLPAEPRCAAAALGRPAAPLCGAHTLQQGSISPRDSAPLQDPHSWLSSRQQPSVQGDGPGPRTAVCAVAHARPPLPQAALCTAGTPGGAGQPSAAQRLAVVVPGGEHHQSSGAAGRPSRL